MTNAERAELDRLLALQRDELLPIAGRAWNAVKGVQDGDWIDLPVDIKGKLNDLAEKYAAGHPEAEGDYAPAGFFGKVRELGGYPLADPAFIAAITKDSPMLQGNRRVGLPSRRVNEAHLNLEHFPGSERRVGSRDRRISEALASFDTPVHLIPGEGAEIRPYPLPEPDGVLGTITVDHAEKSATVNVNSGVTQSPRFGFQRGGCDDLPPTNNLFPCFAVYRDSQALTKDSEEVTVYCESEDYPKLPMHVNELGDLLSFRAYLQREKAGCCNETNAPNPPLAQDANETE